LKISLCGNESLRCRESKLSEHFAILSEGDGYLQLTPEEPFNSGLNFCSPQRQTVQRLFYVWWGKSLTALSFIFALQRYRPSPFYAFDEVDMFFRWGKCRAIS